LADVILTLKDVSTDVKPIRHELRVSLPPLECLRVKTREAFVEARAAFEPDMVLADYELPEYDGANASNLAREFAPDTPFIVLTGSISEYAAVDGTIRDAVAAARHEDINAQIQTVGLIQPNLAVMLRQVAECSDCVGSGLIGEENGAAGGN
jgi:CheY-like chemotaxis protein